MKALVIVLAGAVALAAAGSTAQAAHSGVSGVSAKKPHALWYRATLSVTEKTEFASETEVHFQSAKWEGKSTVAFIVREICRLPERVIATESCDEAAKCARCRRPPRSFDDLTFGVGMHVTVRELSLSTEVLPRRWEEPASNSVMSCTGHSGKITLTKPARFSGGLSTSSLAHDGLMLVVTPQALEYGESEDYAGDETCTRTYLPTANSPGSSYDMVRPGHRNAGPMTSNLWLALHFSPHRVGRLLEVPDASRLLGGGFSIHRKFEEPRAGGGKAWVEVTASFKPCPRGGRAVKRC
jgi:hypothetical protein